MTIFRRIASAIQQRRLLTVIYEFLLIFFAVLGGMWAENWREDLAERGRVKQHLVAMARDLEADAEIIARYDSNMKLATQYLDYVIEHMQRNNTSAQSIECLIKARRIGMLARQMPDINRNTFQELEQAGDMRLLNSNGLKLKISNHYTNYAAIQANQSTIFPIVITVYIDATKRIFDAQAYHHIRKAIQANTLETDSNLLLKAATYQSFSDAELQIFRHSASHLYGYLKLNQNYLREYGVRAKRIREELLAVHAKM